MDTIDEKPPEPVTIPLVKLHEGRLIDDRYRIEAQIGEGGFATVYRAEHVKLARKVAIKVLELPETPTNIDPFIARFMREAQIIASLKHPGIIQVYDFGVLEDSGRPYIAMEFLDGYDLEQQIYKEGPVAPERALRLFSQALEALAVAHDAGVIHKDLKPSNLYIQHPDTPQEQVVLLDFGVAGVVSPDQETRAGRFTATGAFVGTPAYLAPEYIEFGKISPKVDVYQMGLILIEALVGRPAVHADTMMAFLMKHAQGMVDIPESFLQHPTFGPVVSQSIALDPQYRFADASAFGAALAKVKANDIIVPGEWVGAEVGFEATLDGGVAELDTNTFQPHTPNRSYKTLQPLAHTDAFADGSRALPVSDEFGEADQAHDTLVRVSTAEVAPSPQPVVVERREQNSKRGLIVFVIAIGVVLLAAYGGLQWYAGQLPKAPSEAVEVEEVKPEPANEVVEEPSKEVVLEFEDPAPDMAVVEKEVEPDKPEKVTEPPKKTVSKPAKKAGNRRSSKKYSSPNPPPKTDEKEDEKSDPKRASVVP